VFFNSKKQTIFTLVFSTLVAFGATAEEPPKTEEPPKEENPIPGLEILAAGQINATKSFKNGTTVVSPLFGIGLSQQLGPRAKLDLVLDTAPAYGYVIFRNDEFTEEEFNWEGFVDQISLSLNVNENSVLQMGKVRFQPDHKLNPLPLGVDPESRAKNVFSVYGVTYTITPDDKKDYLQFFVGESRDGQLDLRMESEGVALGFAAKKQIVEQLDLYASSYLSQTSTRDNYVRHNLALAYDSKKRFSTYAAGNYFDNSPYHLPDRHWGIEGGVNCRINEKSNAGLTSVCTIDEQQAHFAYYKRQLSPSFVLTGFVGYRSYESDFRRATGQRDSAEVGFSLEFMTRLTPYFQSMFR
jgi:hypothetical protein